MRKVLLWTAGIIVALIVVVCLLPAPSVPSNPSSPSVNQEATPPTVDVDKVLTECLLPKAEYGQYSSYDGGKSAEILLEKECPDEYMAWVQSCQEVLGQDENTCVVKAAIIAQAAIKQFNK